MAVGVRESNALHALEAAAIDVKLNTWRWRAINWTRLPRNCLTTSRAITTTDFQKTIARFIGMYNIRTGLCAGRNTN